jgi:hypothetical protein
MNLADHVVHPEEMRNVFKILVKNLKGRDHRHRQEDNIRVDLRNML